MKFPHEDPEFGDLVRIAANARGISVAMVEKDYWVTHALWALEAQGFEVWFKGGTSLSKGFGLIERFSEDLDLKIEPGEVERVPPVTNWKSDKAGPVAARRTHYEAFTQALRVPGARAELHACDPKKWMSANVRLFYPGAHLAELDPILSPFVLLELGDARVRPALERAMSSFVHDELAERAMIGEYEIDNRPARVRCVHPLVTLLEKLDALHRRVLSEHVAPAKFVRHFEDAARVIAAASNLPALPDYPSVRELVEEMVTARQLGARPDAEASAFRPNGNSRWDAIRQAHRAIQPMFWGPRSSLEDACEAIRSWVRASLHT